MQLCSYRRGGQVRAGAVRADGIVLDLTDAARRLGGGLPGSVSGWVGYGPGALRDLSRVADAAAPVGPAAGLDIVNPLERPARSVLCVGANYREHIEESEATVGPLDLPDAPVWFTKDVRSVCGPYDDIALDPSATAELDWEVELAVVIGRAGRNITVDEAMGHVFGYAVFNDVSARDVQLGRKQWWKGKSLEGTSALGPYLVTADEIPDPYELELRCWVNGVQKQRSSTRLMISDIAHLIADLSSTLTLEPGDVISTGTPAGVGLGRTPPEWLTAGDVVEAEISGLGRQRNSVVDYKG
jgi:2-keto-4-pentenoate hydratase/2-oxohepta-3-ene-1,7-dioic acid hydratase in catechol pathway